MDARLRTRSDRAIDLGTGNLARISLRGFRALILVKNLALISLKVHEHRALSNSVRQHIP